MIAVLVLAFSFIVRILARECVLQGTEKCLCADDSLCYRKRQYGGRHVATSITAGAGPLVLKRNWGAETEATLLRVSPTDCTKMNCKTVVCEETDATSGTELHIVVASDDSEGDCVVDTLVQFYYPPQRIVVPSGGDVEIANMTLLNSNVDDVSSLTLRNVTFNKQRSESTKMSEFSWLRGTSGLQLEIQNSARQPAVLRCDESSFIHDVVYYGEIGPALDLPACFRKISINYERKAAGTANDVYFRLHNAFRPPFEDEDASGILSKYEILYNGDASADLSKVFIDVATCQGVRIRTDTACNRPPVILINNPKVLDDDDTTQEHVFLDVCDATVTLTGVDLVACDRYNR